MKVESNNVDVSSNATLATSEGYVKALQVKRFISCSFGVESTAMCVLYGKGATAIVCDTGEEHKEMYERWAIVGEKLRQYHNGDFELVIIKPKPRRCKGQIVYTLGQHIEAQMYMPSKLQRWCTGKWKIQPIDAYLKQQGECELMLGFNSDEEPSKDRTGNYMKCKNVTYTYPLYEDGYNRNDCEVLLKSLGLHPNMPVYMARGGCKWCPFKSVKEYKALYYLDRETFNEGKRLEIKIQDKRKKFFAISMSGKSFLQIENECIQESKLFTEDVIKEMYQEINNSKSCGAFCHR